MEKSLFRTTLYPCYPVPNQSFPTLLIQFSTMARLFVFLVAIVAVLALVEGGKGNKKEAKGDKKGGRAAKKCAKNIKKFESCLKKGYKSKAGCISEDGELSKKDMKKCGKIEKKLKKCDYSCDKKEVEAEPEPQPEPQPELQPEPEPEPEPEPLPYDLNCKRVGFDFWGADIRSFSASSLEACAMTCVNEPGCKSITSRNSDNYCWLKNKDSGLNGPVTNAALTSMNLECDRSAVDSSCKRDNFDF